MRHAKAGRTFNRDTNARKALFIGLAKNLIEKEQIKTTLPKAKDLRRVVEKLITRAKNDTVANRRLTASELGNSSEKTVKKLFDVLGKRYANRPGGYTRVLKAGFRYGDAAPMAIIELVDRDENAKKAAPVVAPAEPVVESAPAADVAEEKPAKAAKKTAARKTTKKAAADK
ncbi:50S ribosomal protein L17 [bacterium]|nr:50S ribosomal protein L17 [bacterium]